jgi:saccharopine dehydrogenase (NAD+, L-lysine-forming)
MHPGVASCFDHFAAQVKSKHGTTSRFATSRIDASNSESITALCLQHKITHVMNAVDPRYVGSGDFFDL